MNKRPYLQPLLPLTPLLASLLSACASGFDERSEAEDENVGQVVLALTEVPEDVACLRVTAEGATRTEVRDLDVTPGQAVEKVLTRLPVGRVTFTGDAFESSCGSLGTEDPPSWLSDFITITIAPGQLPTVALAMKRNGRARVDVDWADEPLCGADGEACSTGADCCSTACTGGVCVEPEGDVPNTVFVTSTFHTGNLGGLAGADDICAQRASEGGLSGTFVALLSTTTVDGSARLGTSRGWVFPNGLPFADEVSDLFGSHVFYPASVDEQGNTIPAGEPIMTGTQHDGTLDPSNCSNWSSNSGSWFGGFTGYGGTGWTDAFGTSCSAPSHLVCFEVGNNTEVAPALPPSARLAFVTSGFFSTSGGLPAADALCASEAASASLPGSFRALLATASASALSRFAPGGQPWYRLDGVKVADSTADFASGNLSAPLSFMPSGSEATNFVVWTGAPTPSAIGTETCANWTSANSGTSGRFGVSYAGDSRYWSDTDLACDFGFGKIYCLQE